MQRCRQRALRPNVPARTPRCAPARRLRLMLVSSTIQILMAASELSTFSDTKDEMRVNVFGGTYAGFDYLNRYVVPTTWERSGHGPVTVYDAELAGKCASHVTQCAEPRTPEPGSARGIAVRPRSRLMSCVEVRPCAGSAQSLVARMARPRRVAAHAPTSSWAHGVH